MMRRPLPPLRTRRCLALALGVALLVLLAVAPAAFGDAITPESGGSQNADDIDTLYKITLYVAIVIFLIVEGTLIWSLVSSGRSGAGRSRRRFAATLRSSSAGPLARR